MGESSDIEIIRRYFQGKLTDTEYEYLTGFLKDRENRRIFTEEKQKWNQEPRMDDLTSRNWSRLQYKIDSDNADIYSHKLRKIWITKATSIAAILLVGLFTGWLLTTNFLKRSSKGETLVFETPRGEKSAVSLPDGSKVWLNANSKLTYHSFANSERKVELVGEAYFEVAHHAKVPFIVKTVKCDVTVLGTRFNIMAYKDFGRNEITLIEGSVKVKSINQLQILKPGQMLVLKGSKTELYNVNTSLFTGWKDNKFNFKDIPLSELIKRLENWYDVDITLENETGKEVSFTGTFKNEETIWQVLDAIKVYMPIQYERTNLRKIRITVK